MKKLFIIVAILIFGYVGNSFAGGVTDNNNGNAGNIFVSTGENNGANSVGHWTDASSLKGDKGDKGDTGNTGAQGIQGVKGVKGDKGNTGATGAQGIQGLAGNDGSDGLNGNDGNNGANGTNGIDGFKGDTGLQGIAGIDGLNGKDVDPATVNDLKNTDNILSTNIKSESSQRIKADNILQNNINSTNSRIDDTNNRVKQLEKTQTIVGGELRIYDSRKWQVNLFTDYSTTRSTVDRTGIRFTYKLGSSYEEKEIAKVNARLNRLEKESGSEFYLLNNKVGIRER